REIQEVRSVRIECRLLNRVIMNLVDDDLGLSQGYDGKQDAKQGKEPGDHRQNGTWKIHPVNPPLMCPIEHDCPLRKQPQVRRSPIPPYYITLHPLLMLTKHLLPITAIAITALASPLLN